MYWSGDILDALLLLGVVTGTLGVTLYAAISVSNALRLKNVRTSWRCGKLCGFPLVPGMLLVASIAALFSVYTFSMGHYTLYAGCVAWISINWFSASLLTTRHYITDHGIVRDINDSTKTVAWHQIVDYVELNPDKTTRYKFLFRAGEKSVNNIPDYRKLEIDIPSDQLEKFRKIVSYKLGKTVSLRENLPENLKTV